MSKKLKGVIPTLQETKLSELATDETITGAKRAYRDAYGEGFDVHPHRHAGRDHDRENAPDLAVMFGNQN